MSVEYNLRNVNCEVRINVTICFAYKNVSHYETEYSFKLKMGSVNRQLVLYLLFFFFTFIRIYVLQEWIQRAFGGAQLN